MGPTVHSKSAVAAPAQRRVTAVTQPAATTCCASFTTGPVTMSTTAGEAEMGKKVEELVRKMYLRPL